LGINLTGVQPLLSIVKVVERNRSLIVDKELDRIDQFDRELDRISSLLGI